MVKRILLSLLLLLYTFSSMGVVVSAHFCGSKLASLSFYSKSKPCKCSSKKKKNRNCCSNHEKQYKLELEQQFKQEKSRLQPPPFFGFIPSHSRHFILTGKPHKKALNKIFLKPPGSSPQALYLRQSSLLI